MKKFRSRRASRHIEDQSIPNNDDPESIVEKTEAYVDPKGQSDLEGIREEDISSIHSSNSRLSPDAMEPIYDDYNKDAFENTKGNCKFPFASSKILSTFT